MSSHWNSYNRRMAEAVAKVARRINATVEEGKDSLGKTPPHTSFSVLHLLLLQIQHRCCSFTFHQQVVTEA